MLILETYAHHKYIPNIIWELENACLMHIIHTSYDCCRNHAIWALVSFVAGK